MIDWAARARAEIAAKPAGGTAKTDESPVSSVSSAPAGAVINWSDGARVEVSSVSSVPPAPVPTNSALGLGAAAKTVRRSGNPYMTPEQGDECHEGGWNDAEIKVFMERATHLGAMGRPDAEHLAERLTLRDRQADERHMCVECCELEAGGRCAAARRGALTNTDRLFEPTQNILVRCPAFRARAPHLQQL